MATEKKELKSTVSISKHEGYKDMKIILGLDAKREGDFNKMKKIEVTPEELEAIGKHRWLLSN